MKTKKLIKIDKFSKHVFNLTKGNFTTKIKSLMKIDFEQKNGQELNTIIRALTQLLN